MNCRQPTAWYAACAEISAGDTDMHVRTYSFHIAVGLLMLALLLPLAAAAQSLPQTADAVARSIDSQLAERLGLFETPVKGYSLIVTTPVDINDFEAANPLARQMSEELAAWFAQAGYKVQEIRKSRGVMFAPRKGEIMLTRKQRLLANENLRTTLMLSGTYTRTPKHVRFNIRLLHAPSNEVLAMASGTLPLTRELRSLLDSGHMYRATGYSPSVGTSLR